MTMSAEHETTPPSMKDLLAACAAATAVSTPPSGDGREEAPAAASVPAVTPAPRADPGLERAS
ncbi:hypothetical protein ACFVWY_03980 [Streptomyces sp. NPDC058195]|uniref:hypothetical protein n=1 Tax=Streptomyces sp. NPDC058195 TaxID=3346375 RepID=UPI0036ECE166